MGLYNEYIDMNLNHEMGMVWKLIILTHLPRCQLVAQRAQQFLSVWMKGKDGDVVYLTTYSLIGDRDLHGYVMETVKRSEKSIKTEPEMVEALSSVAAKESDYFVSPFIQFRVPIRLILA